MAAGSPNPSQRHLGASDSAIAELRLGVTWILASKGRPNQDGLVNGLPDGWHPHAAV